ncbi:hypothetical protein [Paenibacillus sp. Root444D2]|uniref:hypothetical protein n=1 Tax=Paenibacillus sp. Root444D2 TaxID=1736538 RepID=UPI00268B85A4
METAKNHFFTDISVMLGRSMRHIFRSMDTIITVCITPIAMMLLFVYVLGGAIQTGTQGGIPTMPPPKLALRLRTFHAPYFPQYGHHHHGLHHSNCDDAAVRLCVRRCHSNRNG